MDEGRPLKYNNVEELQEAIYNYFKDRAPHVINHITTTASDGTVTTTPIYSEQKPCSLATLAAWLGVDRKTLYNYSKRDEFFPTIKNAKAQIEGNLVDMGLMGKAVPSVSIFIMKNDFGYADKVEHGFDQSKGKFEVKVDFGS